MATPLRKWRWTPGYGGGTPIVFDNTDFYIEPTFSGQPARNDFVLHGSWAKTAANADPLIRRAAIENAIFSLDAQVGRDGTLEIDWDQGGGRAQAYSNIFLSDIKPVQIENNRFYEVDIHFAGIVPGYVARQFYMTESAVSPAIPSQFQGAWDIRTVYQINDTVSYGGKIWKARQKNFGQVPLNNNAIWTEQPQSLLSNIQYFIVEEKTASRSVFKYPNRGMPIRIKDGPSLRTITLNAIRHKLVASTTLQRRFEAENLMASYMDKIDKEFYLSTDNRSWGGKCLLTDVNVSNLTLPDAVAFALTFQTGYNNG